jgi:hypothetical protein
MRYAQIVGSVVRRACRASARAMMLMQCEYTCTAHTYMPIVSTEYTRTYCLGVYKVYILTAAMLCTHAPSVCPVHTHVCTYCTLILQYIHAYQSPRDKNAPTGQYLNFKVPCQQA